MAAVARSGGQIGARVVVSRDLRVSQRSRTLSPTCWDLLGDAAVPDVSAARLELVEEARSQLSGSARQRFDKALAYAERV